MLAVNPDDAYDVIALNAASASTMISGLPFEGPVSGVRLALIDGQWVAFPRWSERERAVFEIVVAGRVVENGDVAIAMIELAQVRTPGTSSTTKARPSRTRKSLPVVLKPPSRSSR